MRDFHKNNFIQSIKFIYTNIDQPIQLEEIANNVGISLSSLKRLFLDATGQSAGAFIRRLRMELAFRSLQNREDSVLEVALSAGFEDHSAFARCFKEAFGYSPSQARNKLNIVSELECISLEEPEILEINEIKLQSVTKQGLYFEAAPQAWQALEDKLGLTELDDDFAGAFIGMGHDNPHDDGVREDQVRFTAGVTFLDRDLHIDKTIISGGTYAKFCYTGKPNTLGLAYHYIYGKWQESSHIKIHKAVPAFIVFDKFPDGFAEQNMIIYVPLCH